MHPQRYDATEVGAAQVVTLTKVTPAAAIESSEPSRLAEILGLSLHDAGVVDHDVLASIYTPGKLALLVSWTDADASTRWMPRTDRDTTALRHRIVRVVRDYGRFDRREAPQYYPDAPGRETPHAH